MTRRFGLTAKILVLALGNFLLLAAVFAAFLRIELRQDMESFLMSAGRERILAVSRQVALDLEETPPAGRDALLARYAAANGVRLFLFLNDGMELAGRQIALPDEVAQQLRGHGEHGEGPAGMERGPAPPPGLPPRGPGPGLFFVETGGPLRYWVGARIPVRGPEGGMPGHGTLLIASATLLGNPFFFQIEPWIAIVAASALLSILCWLPFVRGLTKSIGRMLHATAEIGRGRFEAKSQVHRRDELGELSDSLNHMAGQLGSLVHGQKRFLADAAHELRSPVGRMQLALELIERENGPTGYTNDLREDVELMSSLAGELLSLARAETMAATIQLAPVPLAPVLARAVKAEGGAAEIRVVAPAELAAMGQPDLLYRSFANIIRNSVRYAGACGPISIRAEAVDGTVRIGFADCGPGVPDPALGKLFEPFYRIEESRNRRTGGAGLGLSIVKSCVEACHGSVECRNRKPSGLETIVRLSPATSVRLLTPDS